MADVFFMKSGSTHNREKHIGSYLMSEIINLTSTYGTAFSIDPPFIGTSTPVTEYSDYQYVVIRVADGEFCEKFPTHGYYIIKDLSVKEAAARLGK